MSFAAGASCAQGACAPQTARSASIEAHLPLVERLVSCLLAKRRVPGVERADLVQEGRIALITAHDRFDAERGVAFSTFATHCISGALRNIARNLSSPSRTPPGRDLSLEDLLHGDGAANSDASLCSPPADAECDNRLACAQLLDQLEPRDALALRLHYLQGLTKAQVAAHLEVSERHAGRIIESALSKLRALAV